MISGATVTPVPISKFMFDACSKNGGSRGTKPPVVKTIYQPFFFLILKISQFMSHNFLFFLINTLYRNK